ncbi:MAG: bifunctional 2-keto-4-hydroxyglutarate aldolase/2-keto-3-deoxy-6-phosphogluconate aldolase [Halanaerobiales bacterium]
MDSKQHILNAIKEVGIVPVIRAKTADEALKLTEAIYEGGINIFEITMTVPGAIEVIKELTEKYKSNDDVIIGAGSVLDAPTAQTAIQAGAKFVVGPAFDAEMVKLCNRYQIPVVPGAVTPTEVVKAMEAGADVVKIFPATLFGPKIIKAIKGPIPQAPLLPTGGVDLNNVADWIKAGSYAVGAGSAIVGKVEGDDYSKVTEASREFVKKIKKARSEI